MSIVQPTPYYNAGILIGNIAIPAMPGMSLSAPANLVVPPIIGNRFQVNVGRGARMATVDVNLIVRNKTTEVFASNFLDLFLGRVNGPANNTEVIAGGITFWNGRTAFVLHGAKAESFTMNSGYGEDLGFSCRFVGSTNGGNADVNCLEPLSYMPSIANWDASPIMRFEVVNFGGVLADNVQRFGLSFSNNHFPDRSMHNSLFPKQMNAGLPTCGLNLTVQAGAYLPNEDDEVRIYIGGGVGATGPPVGGAAFTRVFNIARVRTQNPQDFSIDVPESLLQRSYLCLSTGQDAGPLTYT